MNKLLVVIFSSALLAFTAQAHHGNEGEHGGKRKDRLISKLELTEEQKQPVIDILKEQRQKRKEILRPDPEQVKQKMQALRKETRELLAAVLTEEQLQKYDELSNRREKMMEKRFHRR